jgi:hypothetical protein
MRLRMMRLGMLVVGGCLSVLPGCKNGSPIGSRAPKVQIAADPTADFSSYHNYVFLPGQLSADPGLVKVTSDELDQRMSAALAGRLPAKGLRPAKGSEPVDVYITYVAAVRREAQFVHSSGSRGGYDEPGAIAPGAEWGVRSFDEGALILTFTDARTRGGIWRAAVTSEVIENTRALERGLDAALKGYPPKKKK